MTVVLAGKARDAEDLAGYRAEPFQRYGQGLRVHAIAEDAREFVLKLLAQVPNLARLFFMVDPYGHPLTVPTLNGILQRPKPGAFIFYRVDMDAGNAKVPRRFPDATKKKTVVTLRVKNACYEDEMFGDGEWRTRAFLNVSGWKRAQGFVEYFKSKIEAQ